MRRSPFPPDPVDRAAVEHASASSAFEELFDQIVAFPLSLTTPAPEPVRGRHSLRRRPYRFAGFAAVLLLATMLPIVLTTGGPRTTSDTTPFHAATAFTPSSASRSRNRSGQWQLLDAVLSGNWTQNVDGPPPGSLTCAGNTCYVLSGDYASPDANAPLLSESLYVTTDLGSAWSVVPMPARFDPSSSLSCPSPSTCAVGGTLNDQSVFLVTTDSGSQWTVAPLAGVAGDLVELACSSASNCHGVVGSSPDSSMGRLGVLSSAPDESFVTTTDAGSTWDVEPLPSDNLVYDFSCPDAEHCVAIGTQSYRDNTPGDQIDFVRSTSDDGVTWTEGSLPQGFVALSWLEGLSCPDAEHCLVDGVIPIDATNPPPPSGAPLTTPMTSPVSMSPAVQAISQMETTLADQAAVAEAQAGFYSSGGMQWVSDVASTSDGGLTWTPDPLPADVPDPQLSGISCASATECWAAGSESVVEKVGNATNGGSPILLGTIDGGASWSKVVFTVPTGAPNAYGQSYLSIGQVVCPLTNACIATGAAAQSSPTAPVYGFVSAPTP
jgi:hypothetical protein